MEPDPPALLLLELLVMLVQITTRLGMALIPELAMVKVEPEEWVEHDIQVLLPVVLLAIPVLGMEKEKPRRSVVLEK